jgi:small subunit ribosomal protein S9
MEQTIGLGRRKRSVARVYLRPGTGKVTINSKPLDEFFCKRAFAEESIKAPLKATQNLSKYDLLVTVAGGGTMGQLDAIRHGLARALEKLNPDYRHTLKAAGYLTRDDRETERKKYGHAKARKRFQFSKR